MNHVEEENGMCLQKYSVYWLMILYIIATQTTCPSPLWVRIPTGSLDSFMWGRYPASLRNVGGSTQVPIRARNYAQIRAFEVVLYQYSLNVAIWPILCRCDLKKILQHMRVCVRFCWNLLLYKFAPIIDWWHVTLQNTCRKIIYRSLNAQAIDKWQQ
jgi:hypothetical protein